MKSLSEDDLREIVAVFEVEIAGTPADMRVEVMRNPNGSYSAHSNYSFWGPDQFDSYQNNNPCSTPIEAAKHVVNSMLGFWNESYSLEDIAWVKERDPYQVVILGNGEVVSKDEVQQRRLKENHKE